MRALCLNPGFFHQLFRATPRRHPNIDRPRNVRMRRRPKHDGRGKTRTGDRSVFRKRLALRKGFIPNTPPSPFHQSATIGAPSRSNAPTAEDGKPSEPALAPALGDLAVPIRLQQLLKIIDAAADIGAIVGVSH